VGVTVDVGFVGVGFEVGVAFVVGVGVGLGVDVAATSGEGTDAGELAMAALATALSAGLLGLAIAEPLVIAEPEAAALVAAGEPTVEVDPADDG
jgi:hypothetical protein